MTGKMLVESKGGKVTDLNTDAITCTFPNNEFPFDLIDDKNINGYYWDDEKTIPKYKLEPVGKHVKYPKMEKVATLTGHTYRVLYLAMSPDGSTIVTGAGD